MKDKKVIDDYEKLYRKIKDKLDAFDKNNANTDNDISKVPNYLKNIMDDILYVDLSNEHNKDSLLHNIQEAYKKHGRFSYSHITSICYEYEDREKEETITTNLQRLHDYCEIKNDSRKDIVFKLFDHVNLASKQANKFRNITANFDEKMKEEEELIERKTKEAMDEVKSMKKKLMGELISLIAIFTALSFVIFGGINSLGSLTSSINAVLANGLEISAINKPIILWGIAMFNLLNLFMSFIFKLTDNWKSIFDAEKKWGKSKLFISKYGFVILVNGLLVGLYFIL